MSNVLNTMSDLYCQNVGHIKIFEETLRLDNTGVCVIEVYPSLLCNQMSEKVDLYIKLKLVIFSFI